MKPMKHLFAFILLTITSLTINAGIYDSEELESGLLYGVRMDGHRPCEFLQITLVPDPIDCRPQQRRLTKVLLLANDKKSVLQRLSDSDLSGYGAEQEDLNFDGYRDFRSFISGGTGGRTFKHYLFDPKMRRYKASPELDCLVSPYPDYQEKIIRSYSRGGGMYSTAREHQWVNGKLIVLCEVWRDRDEKGWFTEYSDFKDGVKIRSRRMYLKTE
jgi:hypothetical protein